MTRSLQALASILLLSACAAPLDLAATQPHDGPGVRRATTCAVMGFRWEQSSVRINPTMTTSSDGYCAQGVASYQTKPIGMSVAAGPSHGTLTTSGVSLRPSFRYTATPGYEGPDQFSVTTADAGRVLAVIDVTVVK